MGNLARLSKQKGHQYLIPLASTLKDKNINFEMHLGGTGEMEQEIRSWVKDANLEEYIKFKGFIENPADFLNAIDILMFPSIWEGFGFSIVEAKLCRKPVVAFNITSNPEVINHGKDGFLVEAFNQNALLERTMELIENTDKCEQFGSYGRQDAIDRFSFEISVKNIENYLSELSDS